MQNKEKKKGVLLLGGLLFGGYFINRLRNGNVTVQNTQTQAGRSANYQAANYGTTGAINSVQTVAPVPVLPVFSEAPNILFRHIRFQISNSGQFVVNIKRNGQPFETLTVTGGTPARTLSKSFEADGATYTVDVNGNITTLNAPIQTQTRNDWEDDDQNDDGDKI